VNRGEVVQSHRRGGVARHHQQFDPLVDQEAGRLAGITANRRRTFGAIGDAGGIAQVDQFLMRQLPAQFAQHSQPADPGIEYADGTLSHPANLS
jgi:hypothetical protein